MFTIVQRGAATREKPPEVVRGQASRLPWAWAGLCFAVPFNDGTRDSGRDLVANAAPSEWVGSVSFTKDNRGNVAAATPSGAYIGYGDNPMHNKPTTAITTYARMRRTTTPPVGSASFFGKSHSPGVDPWTTWGMQAADSNILQMAGTITVSGTNHYWENAGYTTDTTTWMSVFMRWISGTSPRQDILGERGQVLSGAADPTTVSGTLSYVTGQPLRLNTADNPTPGTYAAEFSQAMVWSRRLTDTEIQALVADPYGWYSPRRETIGLSSPYPFILGGGEMRHGTTLRGLH